MMNDQELKTLLAPLTRRWRWFLLSGGGLILWGGRTGRAVRHAALVMRSLRSSYPRKGALHMKRLAAGRRRLT